MGRIRLFFLALSCLSSQPMTVLSTDKATRVDKQCLNKDFCSAEDGENVALKLSWLQQIYESTVLGASSVVEGYLKRLEQSPMLTKSITSCFVGGTGDIAAQFLERYWKTTSSDPLNFGRALTIAAEGMFISGPLLHLSYNWMDHHLDLNSLMGESATSKWISCFLQVTIDLLVMDSVFVFTLMVTSAILQGHYKMIPHELKYDFIPTVRVSWLSSLSMAPLQFCNFAYIPLHLRVIITNLEDVVWNAAVSYSAHRSRR